jgi:hypothetical protein
VTLTGLAGVAHDDLTVTARNPVGKSPAADDEYALPASLPDGAAASAGLGVAAQLIGFTIDPGTGAPRVVERKAISITVNSSGKLTTASVRPQAADAPVRPGGEEPFGCSEDIKHPKGTSLGGPTYFTNAYTHTWASYHWEDALYWANKAEYNAMTGKWAWEAMVCASGLGITEQLGYKATLLEDDVEVNSTKTDVLVNGHFGDAVTHSTNVLSTLGFQFGPGYAGTSVQVSSGETFSTAVTDSEIGGVAWNPDAHFGYLFPNPPGQHLASFYPSRLSVWWKPDTPAGRTHGTIGNGGEALYRWWTRNGKNDGGHFFYSLAIIAACHYGQCGYGAAQNAQRR